MNLPWDSRPGGPSLGGARPIRVIPGGGFGLPFASRLVMGDATLRAPAALSSWEMSGGVRLDDLSMDRLMASLGKAFSLLARWARDQSSSICITLAWVLLAWESMAAPACTSML